MDPPPSVPTASAAMPVATATPEPPLDPPGVRSRSHGLRVRPHSGRVGVAPVAELRVVRLADDDRSGVAQPSDGDAIGIGHEVGEDT